MALNFNKLDTLNNYKGKILIIPERVGEERERVELSSSRFGNIFGRDPPHSFSLFIN